MNCISIAEMTEIYKNIKIVGDLLSSELSQPINMCSEMGIHIHKKMGAVKNEDISYRGRRRPDRKDCAYARRSYARKIHCRTLSDRCDLLQPGAGNDRYRYGEHPFEAETVEFAVEVDEKKAIGELLTAFWEK